MTVFAPPIRRDPGGDFPQDVAGQLRRENPGKEEETGVVDDLFQAGGALGCRPANPPVAGRALPGRGAKHHAGQGAAVAGRHPVLEVLSDPGLISQVMISVQAVLQPHPGRTVLGLADFGDLQRTQIAELAGPGRGIEFHGFGIGRRSPAAAGRRGHPQGRQFDPTSRGEFAQQGAGGHVLELAAGTVPAPLPCELTTQLVAAPIRMGLEQCANFRQLIRPENPALHSVWQHHFGPRMPAKAHRVPNYLKKSFAPQISSPPNHEGRELRPLKPPERPY